MARPKNQPIETGATSDSAATPKIVPGIKFTEMNHAGIVRRESAKVALAALAAAIWSLLAIAADDIDNLSSEKFFSFEVLPLFTILSISLSIPAYVCIRILHKNVYSDIAADDFRARCGDEVVMSVTRQLRGRARRLRNMSAIVLVMLCVVLWVGFSTFRQAERSARYAERNSSWKYNFDQELETIRRERTAASEKLYAALAQPDLSPDRIASLERIHKLTIDDLHQREESIERERKRVTQGASGEAGTSAEDGANDASALRFGISLLSTKVGAVLLLVFGAQVLVTLYRYSIRLSAFSDARADALQLAHIDGLSSMDSLTKLLAPESIEFGKTPPSPAQHAVDLARQILSSVRAPAG